MSLWTPVGGSITFSFHCAQRPLLVKEPSRSIQWVAGRKNTSVSTSSGLTPGALQNSAESSMNGSITTFHLSLPMACIRRLVSGPASSGLKPRAISPSSLP